MIPTVQVGNTVSVNYTGKLESGEVFDTSEGKQPLTLDVNHPLAGKVLVFDIEIVKIES